MPGCINPPSLTLMYTLPPPPHTDVRHLSPALSPEPSDPVTAEASDAVSLSGASAEPPADETEDDLRENPQGVKFTGRGRGTL